MPPRKKFSAVTGGDKNAVISNPSAPAQNVIKISPPYLRYSVPAELQQIKASVKTSLDEVRREKFLGLAGQATPETGAAHRTDILTAPGRTDIKGTGPDQIDRNIQVTEGVTARGGGAPRPLAKPQPFDVPSSGSDQANQSPAVTVAQPLPPEDLVINDLLAMMKQAQPAATSQALTLNPVGTVPVGFWCPVTFRARTGLEGNVYYHWALSFNDGTWQSLHGWKKDYTKTRHFDFVLDGETYALSAFAGKGTTKFFVVCSTYYDTGELLGREQSEAVYLEFVNQPCIEISSVSLNASEVKGGDTNDWLTFTITISGKAPPGGQAFHLSTNSNKAKIHGGGTFYIAEGQTSESVSYFLGADNVLKDHDIIIIAKMNGKEGLVNLKIKK